MLWRESDTIKCDENVYELYKCKSEYICLQRKCCCPYNPRTDDWNETGNSHYPIENHYGNTIVFFPKCFSIIVNDWISVTLSSLKHFAITEVFAVIGVVVLNISYPKILISFWFHNISIKVNTYFIIITLFHSGIGWIFVKVRCLIWTIIAYQNFFCIFTDGHILVIVPAFCFVNIEYCW